MAKARQTSNGVYITLEGDRKMSAGLKRAMAIIGNTDGPEASAAKDAIARARSYAPKRSGQLARSLTSTGGQMTSNLPYAGPIHWGWKARGIQENWYLLNAARDTEPGWLRYFNIEMDKAIAAV